MHIQIPIRWQTIMGVEAVDMGLGLAEGAVYSRKAQPKSKKSNGYGKKLYQKSPFEEVNGASGFHAADHKELPV